MKAKSIQNQSKTGNSTFFRPSLYPLPMNKGGQAVIQRDPQPSSQPAPPKKQSAQVGPDPLQKALSDLVKKQLSDKNLQKHLKKLGEKLQKMAVESMKESSDQPQGTAERMAALGITNAFESTSKAILADPSLKHLRKQIASKVKTSPEVALAAVLGGALIAYYSDVKLKGEESVKLGKSGVSVGGGADLGSIQSPEFKSIKAFSEYASKYFEARLGGGVRRETPEGEEEPQMVGEASGKVRVGTKDNNFTGTVKLDTNHHLTVQGKVSLGLRDSKRVSMVFSTDVEGSLRGDDQKGFTVKPGISGKFRLRGDQYLRLGGNMEITTRSGVGGLTGYVEYGTDRLSLQFRGSRRGIEENKGLQPGGHMQFQGMLTVRY